MISKIYNWYSKIITPVNFKITKKKILTSLAIYNLIKNSNNSSLFSNSNSNNKS